MSRLVAILTVMLLATAALAGCGGSEESSGPADYQVDIETWTQIADHKKVEGYVESAWHDPPYPFVIIAIDTRSSDETAPPLASAQLARIQTTKLVGYKERGMRWIRLAGRPAVRWAFNVGDKAHIEYFFEECGISFLVRGTTALAGYTPITEHMRQMATTIRTDCST